MIFRIKKEYHSAKSVEQVREFIDCLSQKEDDSWFGKSKKYKVEKRGLEAWYVKKLGATRNGPDYPSIRIEVKSNHPTLVSLDIRASVFLIIFFALFPLIFICSAIVTDKMTINGVYRRPNLDDRLFVALFPSLIVSVLAYFKSVKPIKDAEKWLIQKLLLEKLS